MMPIDETVTKKHHFYHQNGEESNSMAAEAEDGQTMEGTASILNGGAELSCSISGEINNQVYSSEQEGAGNIQHSP